MEDIFLSDPDCYFEPSTENIIIAVFLMVGTAVSYVPQYVAIVRAKSSDGINFLMLALALSSGFLTAINSGILKWTHIVCCLDLYSVQCLKNNLATEQLVASLLCNIGLYILYIVYFDIHPTQMETREAKIKKKKLSILTLMITLIGSIVISTICGILFYDIHLRATILVKVAQTLGYTSSILIAIQWTPQIWTTFKLKDPGSLSILMLLLQMPGALLVMYFQAILNAADASTWVPYAFLFLEELLLVIMCLYYIVRNRRLNKQNSEERRLLEEVETAFSKDGETDGE